MSASNNGWSDYWSGSKKEKSSGCLTSGADDLQKAQETIWRNFALALARNSSVLDLATGDGAVLKMLRAHRTDLKLTGVDSAAALPSSPKGMKLKAGISLDRLPVADASIDAVTSRFGFEYADSLQSVAEIGRILRPRGTLLLMLHHVDGPVVQASFQRVAALNWIINEQELPKKALAFLRNPMTATLPVPGTFVAIMNEANSWPSSAALEVSKAIWLILEGSRKGNCNNAQSDVLELQRLAEGEMQRLSDLQRAACNYDCIAKYASWFAKQGISTEITMEYCAAEPAPYAWLVRGNRAN